MSLRTFWRTRRWCRSRSSSLAKPLTTSIDITVWNSTTLIISHGKDSFLASDFDSFDSINYDSNNSNAGKNCCVVVVVIGVWIWNGICEYYLEDLEDLENFSDRKSGFELDKKEEDIRDLFEENEVVEKIYEKVVPSRTSHESF